MDNEIVSRNKCRVCGSIEIEPFLRLPAMPMTDHLLKKEFLGSEFRHPIEVHFCRSCYVSQTAYDVHHASYYKDYRYTTGHSPFMQQFMHLLAREVWVRWRLKPGDASASGRK